MGCQKCPTKKPKSPQAEFKGPRLADLSDPIVVAYGGGVDSTGMLIRMVRMGIPIQAILFADTGSEVPRTYNFVKLFSLWLESKGYPGVTWVRYTPKRDSAQGARKGVFETLEEECLRLGTLPALAFNKHTCSAKRKIVPQDQWIEAQPWAQASWRSGGKVVKIVGFDAGEGYRANRTFRVDGLAERYIMAFPLIEWGWTREDCLRAIAEEQLPNPGKSACFFCPARKPDEISELLQEHPELVERALAMEQRALTSGKIKSEEIKGLGGRKTSWAALLGKKSA